MPRRLLGVALVGLGLLAAAPPALAATVGVDGALIRFQAAAGEENSLAIDQAGEGYAVSDLGASLSAGSGCADGDDGAVCDPSATGFDVSLGDGDDSLAVDTAVDVPMTIDGGSGADFLSGASGDDRIDSRDGEADDVSCGDGVDSVSADPQDTVADDCESVSVAQPGGGGATGGGGGQGSITPTSGATGSPVTPTPKPRARVIDCRRVTITRHPALRCVLHGAAKLRGRVSFQAHRLGSAGGASGSTRVRHGSAAVTLRSRRRARPGVWTINAVLTPAHGRRRVYRRVIALL